MTLTVLWNRIRERTRRLLLRNELEREKHDWEERRKLFRRQVYAYVLSGGRINPSRVWAFEFIVRQSITDIQVTLDMMDILASA